MQIGRRIRTILVATMLAMGLAACSGQELYRNIDETEANEMVAALSREGIASEKIAGDDGAFSVEVAQGDFSRSVEVLQENGLPREKFESLGTLFKKEGFSSSTIEQKARLLFGLSQELSHTISQFDGVVEARVHLAIPEKNGLTGVAEPPSASVFIKYREGFDLRSQTAAIKALVTNGVEGLEYDNVSIAMTEITPVPPTPEPGLFDRFADVVFIMASLCGMLLLMVGGYSWWNIRRRAQASSRSTDVSRHQASNG